MVTGITAVVYICSSFFLNTISAIEKSSMYADQSLLRKDPRRFLLIKQAFLMHVADKMFRPALTNGYLDNKFSGSSMERWKVPLRKLVIFLIVGIKYINYLGRQHDSLA